MAFEELKQRQGMVWGSAPFELVADRISDVHRTVVEAVGEAGGKRWLDVACGTGGVAEPAARAGADVTGIDFAPALIETAKERAAGHGLDIDYRVGDAESLDADDASFDVVTSSFGVIFAPDQSRAAGELARVTRPGRHARRSRPGFPTAGSARCSRCSPRSSRRCPTRPGAPLDWGRQEHVEALLGDAFELAFENRTSIDLDESGESFWQFYVENFGPVKTLAGMLDDDRREELHRSLGRLLRDELPGERRYRVPARVASGDGHKALGLADRQEKGQAQPVPRPLGRPTERQGPDEVWPFSAVDRLAAQPQVVSVIGRIAVSRIRCVRGRVRTNRTISATSSPVIIPGRTSDVRPRPSSRAKSVATPPGQTFVQRTPFSRSS